jgi:hypothetical protein
VKSILREKGDILLLETGDQVPVSRQKREATYEALKAFKK